MALSAAPICPPPEVACDPRVAFAVILRPAEEDMPATLSGPSAFGGIVARSPAMQKIFALIENLRESDTTVLLSGESGVGKEVVARAIHEHSPRRGKPFVAVNCGALPGELLESEMFGHVRGAFTGALRDRLGRFEVASEGTLLLDEVGDLPLPLQVKLLRVLQDGSFERVGESRTRVSRARVIAATHIDLARAVREGRFREDLYYRLRVVPIDIPPLVAAPGGHRAAGAGDPRPGRRAPGTGAASFARRAARPACARLAGQRPRARECARVRGGDLPRPDDPARGPADVRPPGAGRWHRHGRHGKPPRRGPGAAGPGRSRRRSPRTSRRRGGEPRPRSFGGRSTRTAGGAARPPAPSA